MSYPGESASSNVPCGRWFVGVVHNCHSGLTQGFACSADDNNDGDVCCGDQAAAEAAGHGASPSGWLVWGVSTQGAHCGLPQCSTNAVGQFNTTLEVMLDSFF